jgi:hypothetical protein
LANTDYFLCQVMARGFWDDLQYVASVFGEDAFREALRHAKPGIFDPGSSDAWASP